MTVGELIKAARKNAGLTQRQLGERLGVAYQTVAQWENDLRNPKLETLQRIAAALGVSVTDILQEAPPPEISGTLPAEFPEDVQRVAVSMDRMNAEGREKVVDYAEDLEASGRYIKTDQSELGKKA